MKVSHPKSPVFRALPLLIAGLALSSCGQAGTPQATESTQAAQSTQAAESTETSETSETSETVETAGSTGSSARKTGSATSSATSNAAAAANRTCRNPQLDLLETEYGLWGSHNFLPTEDNGQDTTEWMDISLAANHFDPCAEFSYIIVNASSPEQTGTNLPPRQVVLFFAGEHLIRGQKMPVVSEVASVAIEGSEAVVDYSADTNGAAGASYRMTYQLSSHTVQETGQHHYTGPFGIVRSDFDRSPQPVNRPFQTPLGNENYRPWDQEHQWINEYIKVPLGETSLTCVPMGYPGLDTVVHTVKCQAATDLFPPVDTRMVSRPLQEPGLEKYSGATVLFSIPGAAYTDNHVLEQRRPTVELPDESLTKIGNVVFDTHGDLVRISNYSDEFVLGKDTLTMRELAGVDQSRWPKDLEPF